MFSLHEKLSGNIKFYIINDLKFLLDHSCSNKIKKSLGVTNIPGQCVSSHILIENSYTTNIVFAIFSTLSKIFKSKLQGSEKYI